MYRQPKIRNQLSIQSTAQSVSQGNSLGPLVSSLIFIAPITIGLLTGPSLLPAIAHQVKTSGSVGATLHIEPNDMPQAGVPSEVWFALTRQGGESIPLTDCDCQLEVYAQPLTAAAEPLLNPPLSPTSAEGYAAIPGAEVTFPSVGAYTLVLTGAPRADQPFSAFELVFDVTVATGPPAVQSDPVQQPEAIEPDLPTAEPNPTDSAAQTAGAEPQTPTPAWPFLQFSQAQWQKPAILVMLVLLMLGLGSVWGLWQKRSPRE